MTPLSARILDISKTHPEMSSREIAAQLYCHPSYVRSVWRKYGCAPRSLGVVVSKTQYRTTMKALKNLFIAITEEGIDVEAAIVQAEKVIVTMDGSP